MEIQPNAVHSDSVPTRGAHAIRLSSAQPLEFRLEVSDDDLHWLAYSSQILELNNLLTLPDYVLGYRYFRLEITPTENLRIINIQYSTCQYCRAARNFCPGEGTIYPGKLAIKALKYDICGISAAGYAPTNVLGVAMILDTYNKNSEGLFLFDGIINLIGSDYTWTRIGAPLYLAKQAGHITDRGTGGRQCLGIALGTQTMLFRPDLT